ncbi:unnamed protein product, partial [Schistocephalus solidus]
MGWPVCLAIRNDFPHQLAVGYNSGHLAVFNLACLHPFYAKYSDNLLRPVFLAQLLPGPIVSLALHPLQNNVIIGLGLDRDVHVWDLHDPACVQLSVPEMIWATPRSGIGGIVVWPRSTTTVWIGREEYITPFGALRRIPTELGSLKQPADLPTNLRSYTTAYPVCSPIDCSYWGMEMGLQPTSSMDFSDSLAYLVLGDGSGRIQFFSHPLNSYKLGYIKRRLYLQNHLSWIYQWSLRKLPPERSSSGPPVENAAMAVETDIDWTSSLGVASTVEAGDDLKTSLVAVLKLEQELDFLNLNGLELRKLPMSLRSSSGPPVGNAAMAVETDIDWTSSLGEASTVEAGDHLKTSLVAVLKLEQELDFLNLNSLIGEECKNEAGGFDEEAGKEILEDNDFYKMTLEESPERPFEAEILAPC